MLLLRTDLSLARSAISEGWPLRIMTVSALQRERRARRRRYIRAGDHCGGGSSTTSTKTSTGGISLTQPQSNQPRTSPTRLPCMMASRTVSTQDISSLLSMQPKNYGKPRRGHMTKCPGLTGKSTSDLTSDSTDSTMTHIFPCNHLGILHDVGTLVLGGFGMLMWNTRVVKMMRTADVRLLAQERRYSCRQ